MSYQREYEKRIPAAVIGVGSHSYRNILPVMNFLPVKLVAVCDVNEELAVKTAAQYACRAFTDTKEMYREMPEIEAVFIAVGPKLHPALAIEALQNGKHFWVEKPISTTAAEVQEIIDAKREDEIVVVGLKKAFMPATVKAQEIIRECGGLKSVLAVYHMNVPGNGEEVLNNHETPNWLRNGVHPLAYMMALGGSVDEVTAITNDEGFGAVILKFKNGVMGTLHLASGPQPNVESYAAFGDKWQLDIQDTKISFRRGIPFVYRYTDTYAPEGFDHGTIVWDTSNCLATLENKAEFTQGFFNETKYFCDCVLEKKQPKVGTLEDALEMMKVYEAALLSGGKPVKIV